MENYRQFAERNKTWNGYYINSDFYKKMEGIDPMLRNYEVAKSVEKKFLSRYNSNSPEPQVGDVVEFSDGYNIYAHAVIAESLNKKHDSKFHLLNVCENGSSWTDGESFSTSGGSFHTFHASRFALVGRAVNMVWTWGCHGAGAEQGIYFHLNVRRWVIPYSAPEPLTRVRIYGNGSKDPYGEPRRYAVSVTGQDFFNFQSFVSIRAFLAWAEYVGFEYEHIGNGADRCGLVNRRGFQFLKRVMVYHPKQVPSGAKPLKMAENGIIVDAWTKRVGDTIFFYVPNINWWNDGTFPHPILSRQEEIEEFWKYSDNPLGI